MARRRSDSGPFRAIAHPTRRRVLHALRNGELSVGELQRRAGISQSALSQHLAVLRRVRLVTERRDGRRRLYRLRPEPLRAVADWLRWFDRVWEDRLTGLADYLEARR